MIGSISGQIKAKAARLDPSSYGRSDTSAVGRWFWEIDKVLLLLIAMLIGIGLIAVAAASPAAGERYSGGNVRFSELHYFYRQIFWIGISMPVMIAISMMSRDRARRFSLIGAGIFLVLLAAVPFIGEEKNGAVRWIQFGIGQVQPSEFLKPFYVVLRLYQPQDDQRLDGRGGGAAEAGKDEDGQTGQIQPFAPDDVAKAAEDQHEHRMH